MQTSHFEEFIIIIYVIRGSTKKLDESTDARKAYFFSSNAEQFKEKGFCSLIVNVLSYFVLLIDSMSVLNKTK